MQKLRTIIADGILLIIASIAFVIATFGTPVLFLIGLANLAHANYPGATAWSYGAICHYFTLEQWMQERYETIKDYFIKKAEKK